jgi:hypothetical protein
MKKGKTLMELAQELTRIQANAKDYVVPTEKLRAEVKLDEKPEVVLGFTNGHDHQYKLNNWSKTQLATYTDIPKGYFDRLASEKPQLLADNINHGLDKITSMSKREGKPESRLLRTIDGKVRGLLSSRYRILDAHDMLEATLPTMLDAGMQVVSSEITEQRLFIKALSPKLMTEVKKGDAVQYGLTISTSDVGAGSVRVEPLIYRLVCLNGMISNTAIRKFHVGKNQAENDIQELLSDKTKELTDQAFWAQVRDIVLASMKPENFEKEVDRLRLAANLEIKNFDLPRVVELSMKATGIVGETKKNSILSALASGNEGAGLTQWGLINAFTRAAQADDFSYEESIEMERAAGSILELPKSQWSVIAATA